MLPYIGIHSTFFSDTMFATPESNSTRGNNCCQLSVSEKGAFATYPMRSQEEVRMVLHLFFKQIVVPVNLVVDVHQYQTYIKVNRLCDQTGTILKILEKDSPWKNRSELYVVLPKEAVLKDNHALHSPMVIWDYIIEHRSLIRNTIPHPLFQNNGLTPNEVILVAPSYISNICVYGCYELT